MTAEASPTASAPSHPPAVGSVDSKPDVRFERLVYGDRACPLRASVIIPTLDGRRRGLLAKLIDDLHDQTLDSFEVILIKGERRQGRAINRGVARAASDIVVTMDDDTVIGTARLLQILVGVLDSHPDVGMVGASTVLPPTCSRFQARASRQIPRRLFPIVDHLTESDMVQHPCLAMRKHDFLAVGGEDEELKRGLDPLLRFKVRRTGLRVVIAPHCFISHPLPEGLPAVLRMYFRNGRGSAFAQLHHPDRIYQLTDGHRRNRFTPQVPLSRRCLRYPLRMLRSLGTGRFIRLAVEHAYAMGFAYEYLRERMLTGRPHWGRVRPRRLRSE